MKIIVYTANIGNYDNVELPLFMNRNQNVQFIQFTTNLKERSNSWNLRFVEDPNSISKDPQRVARYFKLQPHKVLPPHDVSIWFDSCLSLKINDYTQFISEILLSRGLDMVSYNHPKRNCLYREAIACISQRLDNKDVIENQIKRYKQDSFPSNFGLYDTGFIIRVNNPKMQEFNDLWYSELENGSKRDQISHPYCTWKKKIKINTFLKGVNKGKSPYLVKRKHIKLRNKISNQEKQKESIAIEILNKKIAYKMRLR